MSEHTEKSGTQEAISIRSRGIALRRANNINPLMGDTLAMISDWVPKYINGYEHALTALEARNQELEAILRELVGHYQHGVNPYMDRSIAQARAALQEKGEA